MQRKPSTRVPNLIAVHSGAFLEASSDRGEMMFGKRPNAPEQFRSLPDEALCREAAAGNRDFCAFVGKAFGGGKTDTAVTAGDDGDLTCKAFHKDLQERCTRAEVKGMA